MKIDGACHCGFISYEAEIDPAQVSICHCTDCQSLTGSPFRVTVLCSRGAIALTGPEPKVYSKVGDNGKRRHQHFCPRCGAPLFTGGEGADADDWGIRWGSIRQRAELSPKRQIWCGSAVSWLSEIAGLPAKSAD